LAIRETDSTIISLKPLVTAMGRPRQIKNCCADTLHCDKAELPRVKKTYNRRSSPF